MLFQWRTLLNGHLENEESRIGTGTGKPGTGTGTGTGTGIGIRKENV